MTSIQFELVGKPPDGGSTSPAYTARRLLLAGYTGRDQASVLAHIRELEELGVAPPPRVPMVYELDPALLTTHASVAVSGAETSGEVEFVLLRTNDELLVGIGSDHTDRAHEAIDVTAAKAMCPKPIGRQLWRLRDIADHWDELEIRSWMTAAPGDRRLYQAGRLAEFLTVDDLLNVVRDATASEMDPGTVVFGGTLPAPGGFVYGNHFEAELHDPVLGRRLSCAYDVVVR